MGILVRSGPLSDPEVRRLIAEYFVPVAMDVGELRADWQFVPEGTPNYAPDPASAAEIELFGAIAQQAPMSQGIWLVAPDGKVLRKSYHVMADPLLRVMRAAIADWQNISAERPLPLASGVPSAKAGTVRLAFYGRMLDGTNHAPFRDFAHLSPEHWTDWIPGSPEPGDTVSVPETIMAELAARLYPGEMRLAVRRDEFQELQATVRIREIEDGVAAGELSGVVELAGSVPFSSRRRQYRATLAGEIRWRLQPRELIGLELVSDGTWQSEYPPSVAPSQFEIYPGGSPPGGLKMSPPIRLMFLVELSQPDSPAG